MRQYMEALGMGREIIEGCLFLDFAVEGCVKIAK